MKLLYIVESGNYKYLVFDEMPDKISTKYGDDTIIGRIGGIFYDFLAKRNERREAFGGRKFDIVLDNGEIEKCEGQWWDAATDRAREELEKEGNPLSKMVLIGVSSVDRLLDCYVYYGLWASESKIEEMIADYKGRIYEYYEFKEEVINKISPYIGQEFLPGDLKDFDYRGELIEDLDDEDLLDIISKYGKDVVAIEWSTRGYNQGDYIKGIAYVTKEKYDNEVCNKEGDWKEDCAKIIDNEVKSIGMWMWGDVKGYVLEKKVAFTKRYKDESREDEDCEEWEEVDSCWGCYEETDELIKEVMIENGLEE